MGEAWGHILVVIQEIQPEHRSRKHQQLIHCMCASERAWAITISPEGRRINSLFLLRTRLTLMDSETRAKMRTLQREEQSRVESLKGLVRNRRVSLVPSL